MRKTIDTTLRSFLFFLAAGMFLFSCKEDIKLSSEASMTSLTLTVGDTDYAITFTGKEGKITLPYSTALPVTATVKAVALSAKATGVKVGDTVTLPVSGTVTFTVTAEDDKTTGVYTLTVEKASASKEASITSLTLTVGDTDYAITFTGKEGKITLPYSTQLPADAVVKTVVLSAKATGIQVGDVVTIPASDPVTFTVTAEDGTTKETYTLTAQKASASKEASITSLTLTVGDSDYKIDFTDRAYTLVLPAGSTLPTAVGVKEIALSAGATGVANDDELPVTDNAVTFTVTAEDGETTQNYTVVFSVAANEGASITSLTLTAGSTDYDITFEGTQSSVTVPYGTALPTAVDVKEITLSAGATSDAGNGTALTVTDNAVTITVTAEDGTTKSAYTVTFSVAANSEASITSLTLTVGDTDYEITFEDRAYTLVLSVDSTLPTAVGVKQIALSAGATSDAGNELTVTDNAVTITVTAEDGETTQEYTVSLVVSVGITSFTFEVAANENMALDEADRQRIEGEIDQQAKTITFPKQSAYVYLNRLKASFTASAGATAQVGGADQVSGVTEQDFSSPVNYVVRAADGTETTYTVTLTKSTLATIPDAQFRAKLKEFFPSSFTADQLDITSLEITGYIYLLDVQEQTPKLTSLKGIEFFADLTNLSCDNNALTSLDVSKNTALTRLDCNGNSLETLDVSSNTALTTFYCRANLLTSLDLSKNTALMTFYCGANRLTYLDITGMRSAIVSDIVLDIGTGTGENNPLATLRVNTVLQDRAEVITMKTARGAALTVITVDDAGTEVCADYTPAEGGGTCN